MPLSLEHARLISTAPALHRAGYTRAYVRAQLAAGRWRRWGRAVALHNGPLSREQGWFVARVHAGPRALLTGFTALEAYGLRGWERDLVDVLAPLGTRRVDGSPVPWRLHRRRDWAGVRRNRSVRVHVPQGALLVAAGSLPAPRPACGLVAAAVQQRIVRAAAVRAALEAQPRLRHRRALVLALVDIEQGADALSEIDFARLCRRHGLPAPQRQAVRRERSGRRRYLDASWRRRDGRLVVAEVDGALHLDQRRWWDDQARQNELVLADAVVLRFPSVVVRTDEHYVAGQLRRALRL
jgi:hypothetical protein